MVARPTFGALALAVLLSLPAGRAGAQARYFGYDVALDLTTFAGNPGPGGNFIIHGYIYAQGTLTGPGAIQGVLATGGPEDPNAVIGLWTCTGNFMNGQSGADSATAVTTQVYELFAGGTIGHLVTNGYEAAPLDSTFERPVVGGSGDFAAARGVAAVRFLGNNVSGAPSFVFDISYETLDLPDPTATSADVSRQAPSRALRFGSAAPNPFSEATSVELSTPLSGEHVVDIVAIGGRRVRRVHEGALAAGRHDLRWDGTDDSGRRVASGAYFYVARGPAGVTAKKVITVR